MRRTIPVCAALLSCAIPPLSVAAEFAGDAPLICAALQSFGCESDADCAATPLEEINVPQFLRVNFEEKVIRSKRPNGDMRVTPIEGVRSAGDRLLLQGLEQGAEGMFAWNIVIGQAKGEMTLTVAGDGFAVVIFGACTPNEIAAK